MIDIQQALSLVLSRVRTNNAINIEPGEGLGHVLAADVLSDVDSPPHDKALMDGYAVRSEDIIGKFTVLEVLEEVVAGTVPTVTVTPGKATRIMTGAPMPQGADAVVMVEKTELSDVSSSKSTVRILMDSVPADLNVMKRATTISRGQVVLSAGAKIRHVEVGLLSEVGARVASVVRQPTVAVLPTGDELVPITDTPGPGQIRNSNGPMLAAAVKSAGGEPTELEVGRDNMDQLLAQIRKGLTHDLLLLSGGVSAGVKDLVPAALAHAGVECVFHKVRIKPGKPLWFGVRKGNDALGSTLVFGLPGNPVSSLVCFEVFVRPALAALAGHASPAPRRVTATLASRHLTKGDRPTFYPAKLMGNEQSLSVQPLTWFGSADLASLAEADGLVCFPAGDRAYQPGDHVQVHTFV